MRGKRSGGQGLTRGDSRLKIGPEPAEGWWEYGLLQEVENGDPGVAVLPSGRGTVRLSDAAREAIKHIIGRSEQ